MRYVVIGAGAVGGTIGGRLAQHGHDVAFVARGAHGAALAERGLELRDPDGSVRVQPPVAATVAEANFGSDDVVIVAVKTQDALGVFDDLAITAGPSTRVVCAQNGVEAERMALRRFRDVYAMCVMLPATHLEPGVVAAHSSPVSGILDLGRYPIGTDDLAVTVAADLSAAQFRAEPVHGIMRRKYAKLLMNLGNAITAACGPDAQGSDLHRQARLEALACFVEAGIDVASDEEDRARRAGLLTVRPVARVGRGGGSSWQSLARGTGSIESDYLNGEIVLLGRLHGVATPVNAMLQQVAREMAERRDPPGSMTIDQLEARIAAPAT